MNPEALEVRHLLDIFVNDVGFEAIEEKVNKATLRAEGCPLLRLHDYPTSQDWNPSMMLNIPPRWMNLMKSLGRHRRRFPTQSRLLWRSYDPDQRRCGSGHDVPPVQERL